MNSTLKTQFATIIGFPVTVYIANGDKDISTIAGKVKEESTTFVRVVAPMIDEWFPKNGDKVWCTF